MSDASTGVAGHVFNTPSSCHYGSLDPAVSSLRPIWHRVFVSRGGSAIRQSNHYRQLQRSFQLAPEFLASSRQSRFHRSHTNIQRGRDLFVRKTFNISQDHCFPINSSQTTQRFFQRSLSFVSESVRSGSAAVVRFQRRNKRRPSAVWYPARRSKPSHHDACVATSASGCAPG